MRRGPIETYQRIRVVTSSPTGETGFVNPTNAVGGFFILNLQDDREADRSQNPTNAVGGSFIPNLQGREADRSSNTTNALGGIFGTAVRQPMLG